MRKKVEFKFKPGTSPVYTIHKNTPQPVTIVKVVALLFEEDSDKLDNIGQEITYIVSLNNFTEANDLYRKEDKLFKTRAELMKHFYTMLNDEKKDML